MKQKDDLVTKSFEEIITKLDLLIKLLTKSLEREIEYNKAYDKK